jgi:hypothetical protein
MGPLFRIGETVRHRLTRHVMTIRGIDLSVPAVGTQYRCRLRDWPLDARLVDPARLFREDELEPISGPDKGGAA